MSSIASIASGSANSGSDLGITVQKKAMDAQKTEAEGVLKMISPPGTGQNVNTLA